jgi:hypothetical protein
MDLWSIIFVIGTIFVLIFIFMAMLKDNNEMEEQKKRFKKKYGDVIKNIFNLRIISGVEVAGNTDIFLQLTKDNLLINNNAGDVDKPLYILALNKIVDSSVKVKIENEVVGKETHRSIVTNTHKTVDKKVAFEYADLTIKYSSSNNKDNTIVFRSINKIYLGGAHTGGTEKLVDFSNSIRHSIGLTEEDVFGKKSKKTVEL